MNFGQWLQFQGVTVAYFCHQVDEMLLFRRVAINDSSLIFPTSFFFTVSFHSESGFSALWALTVLFNRYLSQNLADNSRIMSVMCICENNNFIATIHLPLIVEEILFRFFHNRKSINFNELYPAFSYSKVFFNLQFITFAAMASDSSRKYCPYEKI